MLLTHFVVFELVLTIEPNLAQLAIDELPGHLRHLGGRGRRGAPLLLVSRKLVVEFL